MEQDYYSLVLPWGYVKQYKRVSLKYKLRNPLYILMDNITISVLLLIEKRIECLYNLCGPEYGEGICEEI
jgi:hypothetical protein